MIPWTRWRKPWGEPRHGPGTWPKAWRTCWRLCPHVSSSFTLTSQTVKSQRFCSRIAAIYTFSSLTSGNKRRQDTAAESRRISEGEQKIARSPLSFFYAVTPSPFVCFAPRPTEEEQIGSHGPAGGGKAIPALLAPSEVAASVASLVSVLQGDVDDTDSSCGRSSSSSRLTKASSTTNLSSSSGRTSVC